MGSDFYVGTALPDDGKGPDGQGPHGEGPHGEGPDGEGQAPDWNRLMNPPDNEIPIGVPLSVVVGRAEGLAVALTGARVYSTGVQFDIVLRRRTSPSIVDHNHAMEQFMGHDYLGRSPDRFLLGVEFPDGRQAANIGRGRQADPDPAVAPHLVNRGGSGGGRSMEQTMWLAPVPPAGPLMLVCSWAAMGIPETTTVLDGTTFAEAAARVETLWPWEPEPDQLPESEPDRAPLPGWFGQFDG